MAGRIKERKGKVWMVKAEAYARKRWKNAVYKSASKIVGSSTFESYTHKFRYLSQSSS